MKRLLGGRQTSLRCARVIGLLAFFIGVFLAAADQVRMKNGDTYFGTVVSLDSETLVLKSEVLGNVHLPRAKLAGVAFGVNARPGTPQVVSRTNPPVLKQSLAITNSSSDLTAAFRQLGADTNLIQQVQAQFLGGAGPEANDKFNQLLGGLISGKLNLNDLRAEAKSAADQVRAARKDLGEEAGPILDGYLAILDSFLRETTPGAGVVISTNSPSLPTKSKPAPAEDE